MTDLSTTHTGLFRRIFIANRGEIAVRVIRACREMGIETVLGASRCDMNSLAAEMADRVLCIGPESSSKSYLDPRLIVTAALGSGCDALHPGYGFLSESGDLQQLCTQNGIKFIGPSAAEIDRLGNKINALNIARQVGAPTIPGTGRIDDPATVQSEAKRIGYPIIIKAAAGGGGKGMRVVHSGEGLEQVITTARAEALAAFSDDTIYMERFIERARHIEVQVAVDATGAVRHFFERECSIQRRHQKVIEEAPCSSLPQPVKDRIIAAAIAIISAVEYENLATVEFVVDDQTHEFFFLEVNSRLQVEHPVTEMITGCDLVQLQIKIAAGIPFDFAQADIKQAGAAIECRINAEDPTVDFRPSPGTITEWHFPQATGFRLDTYGRMGAFIPPFYDSMIGKAICHASDRKAATTLMHNVLADAKIGGIKTNLVLHSAILTHENFADMSFSTRWIETSFMPEWTQQGVVDEPV